jgi:hypothetical protein
MSGKKAKHSRREIRELFGPLQSIAGKALEEANGNFELFSKWAAMAAVIKKINPDIPVDQLLPSSLETTVRKYNPELLN